MNIEKRSPLKDRPLRNPAQSLDEQLDELVIDKIAKPITIAGLLLVLAGLEWWRYYFPQKPIPILYTAGALVGIGYAAFQIWRVWPRLRALKQGRDGERAVGQYLERLRETGYQVFHDVVGAGSMREVWVLNPKALPDFLANEPQVLKAEDVKLASFHLSRFIRTGESAKK